MKFKTEDLINPENLSTIHKSNRGYKFDEFPFKNRIVKAQLSIFKLPQNYKENNVPEFRKDWIVK